MWGLLISTILTSATDSLNPFAITQQFVLQGMVKKPRHIWYYIIPTGVTNLIGGFLAYFGLVAFIGDFISKLVESLKEQIKKMKAGKNNDCENDEAEVTRKIKSVSPTALVFMGVGATISELTTALPYFAFLAILFNYQLTFPQLTLTLILYNTIYTLPLIMLYFVYIKAQDKFDYLYRVIKAQVTKWANVFASTLVSIIGFILVYHSVSLLTAMV